MVLPLECSQTRWKNMPCKLWPVTTGLLSGFNYCFTGLNWLFITCPISLVLAIYTAMNEAQVPSANCDRWLMPSVSVPQRTLEAPNNTSTNTKCTGLLYLLFKMLSPNITGMHLQTERNAHIKKKIHQKARNIMILYCVFRVSCMTKFANLFCRAFLRVYHL